MKRIISALAAVVLACSAVSCGSSGSSTSEKNEQKTTAATVSETTADVSTTTVTTTRAAVTTRTKTTTTTVTTTAPASGDADILKYITVKEAKPALWKATDPETGNSIYMMGTLHLANNENLKMPEYILDAYKDAEAIAIEHDFSDVKAGNVQAASEMMKLMLLTDGTTITDHISTEAYEKAKEFLTENSIYNSAYDAFVPGFWIDMISSVFISKLENLDSDGVEGYFVAKAKEDGKAIIDIETLETQVKAITDYTDDLADYMILATFEDTTEISELAQEYAKLYDCWASGDTEGAWKMNEEDDSEIPDEYKADYAAYNDFILTERNRGMAEKAAEYIKDGKKYLFMVGFMHYCGDQSVLKDLESMGYKVERVN